MGYNKIELKLVVLVRHSLRGLACLSLWETTPPVVFLLLPSLSLRLWPRNLRQHLIAERNGFCWANELGTSAETVYALPEKEETPWSGSAEEPDGAAGFQLLLGVEGRLRSRFQVPPAA